ncbi:MAG TPA: 2,3-bisphosphoglycerate-independent phosphoglycerate mutase [Candidatus Tumulicola sp.]|jgi:2,3-bisphosphoglycerate-independent phosphoglycerate mutase
MTLRPLVLAILDGWGCSDGNTGNAIAAASTPNWDSLLARYPHTTLAASGVDVGLPSGIMGNSEVGHLNLGSGRVVPQGLVVIDEEVASGGFARNPVLVDAIAHVRRTAGTLHLMGLVSDGCVHSSLEHLFALIDAAVDAGIPLAIHAFLDGRDTPPRSAQPYIERVEEKLAATGRQGAIADVSGRFYAMDRDKRWDRTRMAYDMLANGIASQHAATARAAIDEAYARGEDDEFVLPCIVGEARPVGDGDACIFFNFRPDRARQITAAFDSGTTNYKRGDFEAFAPRQYADLYFATMTKYEEHYPNPVLFGPRPQYDTFGDVLAANGLKQLRLAETEKYAHVTYFFNGGREEELAGETRTLVPSDRSIATYDLAPEMRAVEITAEAVAAIQAGTYDAIVMNYANADMVGHTGKWKPTIRAVEVLDDCIGRLATATLEAGGALAITADHGNAEEKIDADGNPLTAHTTNRVPFVIVSNDAIGLLSPSGRLADVAPTLLRLIGLAVPSVMSGRDLLGEHAP